MPVRGLNDNVRPQWPTIGHLRKGDPKRPNKDGKLIQGKDRDSFRFESYDPYLAEQFGELYGSDPRHMYVLLASGTVENVWETCREEYNSQGQLQHRCDGEVCSMFRHRQTGEIYTNVACPYANLPQDQKKCKQIGRLHVFLCAMDSDGMIIPAFDRAGVITVHTTSNYDIRELTANLQAAAEFGNLWGVPFVLYRRKRSVLVRIGQARKREEKSLLFLEVEAGWFARRMRERYHESFKQAPVAVVAPQQAHSSAEDEEMDDDVYDAE